MAAKPAKRMITAQFFGVGCGADDRCLSSAVIEALKGKSVADRNVARGGDVYRLHEWRAMPKACTGALLRLRTGQSPKLGSLTGEELRDVPLAEGEYVAEYFCFAYFPDWRVLALHRNRDAGGHSRLEGYLQDLCGVQPVVLNPLFTTDGLQRLGKMKDLTVAELTLAMPKNLDATAPADPQLRQTVEIARHAGAATISIRLSMGQRKAPLSQGAWEFVRHAMGMIGFEVKTARVRGHMRKDGDDDLGELLTLDLIEDMMRERIELPADPTVSEICDSLVEAYERRRSEIQLQVTAARLAPG